MDRKGKTLFIVAVVFVLLFSAFAATGCTDKKSGGSSLGSSFKPYDEKAFVEEMAKAGDNKILFADKAESDYSVIVCPPGLSDNEEEQDRDTMELKSAAEYLSKTLKTITGADFYLENAQDNADGKALILALDGDCGAEDGGYRLEISDERIRISAVSAEGLTAGIYSFLEDKLGCMFVSPEYDYIPSLPTVYLEKTDETFAPSIKWRYVYADEADIITDENGEKLYGDYWYSKLRLNGAGTNDWYAWVHTSFTYVSPDEYFDEHPEYFSLYNGKRTYEQGPVSGQLCWTNEDVYEIISTKVLQEMRDNPDVHIWDISQMDTWESRGVGCQCEKCKAIDEREGSQIGSILTFINRLAAEAKEEFPDNYISTLAYNYSDEPPKYLRPADNVIIKLCLMPGDCASSYADPTSGKARDAHDLIEAWGDVAEHIVVWDYNIDFHNYMMPFPILDYLKENNDFYIENNVYGIFHQMSADKGGDFSLLNSYMFAKLMWDKDVDVNALFNKYLTVYYGEAAPYIAEYYALLTENLAKSGDQLYIYAKPYNYICSYLSPSALDDYLEIFDKAEQAVAGDSTLLSRVELAEKGVLFAKAAQFSADMKGRSDALEKFVRICEENGIDSLIEGEQNGDELAIFYKNTNAEIKAMPAIIIAMIIGSVLLLAAIAAASLSIYCKVKYKTFKINVLFRKKSEKAEEQRS